MHLTSIKKNSFTKMSVNFCSNSFILQGSISESSIIQRDKLRKKILMKRLILILRLPNSSTTLEAANLIRLLWLAKLYHLIRESPQKPFSCHWKILQNNSEKMVSQFLKKRNKNVFILLMWLKTKICIILDSQSLVLTLPFP